MIGRRVGALAVEEVDVGAAGHRHPAGHLLIDAIVARLHRHVVMRLRVGQEDTRTWTDLQALACRYMLSARAHFESPFVQRFSHPTSASPQEESLGLGNEKSAKLCANVECEMENLQIHM